MSNHFRLYLSTLFLLFINSNVATAQPSTPNNNPDEKNVPSHYDMDLSDHQSIAAHGAAALSKHYGLIGNQLIKYQKGYWELDQKLPAVNSSFGGGSVDIDRKTLIIGNSSLHDGRAVIFELKDSAWEKAAEFHHPELGLFGEAVYIEPSFALISAPKSNIVIGYQKVNDQWQESFRLSPDTDEYLDFGASVDKEGDQIFIGANQKDRVYIFTKRHGQWQQTQIIDHAIPNRGKQFGWQIDAEGKDLAIAAYTDGEQGEGLVHIYRQVGDQYFFQQTLSRFGETESGYFGHYLQLENGNLFVGDDLRGNIFHFVSQDSLWVENKVIKSPRGTAGDFGYFFAINKHFLLVGGSTSYIFGPEVPRSQLTGQVVDVNGKSLYRATLQGVLDSVITDESGTYTLNVPKRWSGEIQANYDKTKSTATIVNEPKEDMTLPDLVIEKEFFHEFYLVYLGLVQNDIKVKISGDGIDEIIPFNPPIHSVILPNHWQGELRLISDSLIFSPEKVTIDKLIIGSSELFRSRPK